MNTTEHNGFRGTASVDERCEQVSAGTPPNANGIPPYVPVKDKAKPSLKDNARLLLIGGGVVLVLLLLAFNGISHRSLPAQKTSTANGKQQQAQLQNGARGNVSSGQVENNRGSTHTGSIESR